MRILALMCAGFVVACLVLSGCSESREEDVAERLAVTIDNLQRHGGPADEETLAALLAATPESLRTPHIACVRVIVRNKTSGLWVRLWVEWIEDKPTPDAVLVYDSQGSWEATFEFDELYREENLRASEALVLFRFVRPIEPESEMWETLYSRLREGGLQAVLLRDGERVSNVVDVRLVE